MSGLVTHLRNGLRQCQRSLATLNTGALSESVAPPAFPLAPYQRNLGHVANIHKNADLYPSSYRWSFVRNMFIQTQPTPNPSSLMFLPGKQVMEQGSQEFSTAREAMASPLATALFRIGGVAGVFFGSDFVTVKKTSDTAWDVLKPEIYAAIMDHFATNQPLFHDASSASPNAIQEDDSEVVQMIKELIETRIRPAVAEDGGDVVFSSFDASQGKVVVKMQGACSGCPSSSVTLKSGIEQMMKHYIPEVVEVVEAPPDEIESEGIKAFNKMESVLST